MKSSLRIIHFAPLQNIRLPVRRIVNGDGDSAEFRVPLVSPSLGDEGQVRNSDPPDWVCAASMILLGVGMLALAVAILWGAK